MLSMFKKIIKWITADDVSHELGAHIAVSFIRIIGTVAVAMFIISFIISIFIS